MKTELEVWNARRRRQKDYIALKREYDAAEGRFVERVWQASQVLGLYYIDAAWMMGAWRDVSGVVTPTPANFDPVRDAEPPPRAFRLPRRNT